MGVSRLFDEQEVRRAYSLLVEPHQVIEVRILEASTTANGQYLAIYSNAI
jgi:hypothetical protein